MVKMIYFIYYLPCAFEMKNRHKIQANSDTWVHSRATKLYQDQKDLHLNASQTLMLSFFPESDLSEHIAASVTKQWQNISSEQWRQHITLITPIPRVLEKVQEIFSGLTCQRSCSIILAKYFYKWLIIWGRGHKVIWFIK